MGTGGKKLSNTHDSIGDVMPYKLWKLPEQLANMVTDYVWATPLEKPFLFSSIDYTLEKILFLVKNAGPLDEFNSLVKKCISKELVNNIKKNDLIDKSFVVDGVQGTIVQLLICRLDLTLRNNKDIEISKGMAESLMDIVAELLPDRLSEVQEQARSAMICEDEQAKLDREYINLAALNRVFDAFKQDDEIITQQEIKIFKKFIKDIKLSLVNDKHCLNDNRYYLNLIHLINGAFEVLAKKGNEFLPINANDRGGWYGKKADRFCFEVIGSVLQRDLPPRVRQILMSGIYHVFNSDHPTVERLIDVGSFGDKAYYDDIGVEGAGRGLRNRKTIFFKSYYEQLYQQSVSYHNQFNQQLQHNK